MRMLLDPRFHGDDGLRCFNFSGSDSNGGTAGCRRCSPCMIRKLKSGDYRLYSRKLNPKTGKRRNLGTFSSREAAEKHERDVQYFKRH
jgi:hypothetical protein